MLRRTNIFLVQVSVDRIIGAGFISASGQQAQAVTLCGRSPAPELCFVDTVIVADKSLRNMLRLQMHGSVVVAVSDRWQYEYDAEGGWLQHVFNEVIRIVTNLPQQQNDEADVEHGFDQALAKEILEVLNKIYPATLPSPMELKYALNNQPDDQTLMTALDALLGDRLITGKFLREHTTGEGRLLTLARIQISHEGKQKLQPPVAHQGVPPVVHGDQFINYGNMGAAGRNSSGTVVVSGAPSQNDVLPALDALLLMLRKEAPQTPEIERAQREFHKVRDEIADEEQPDQTAITKWLSKGKQLLATAALGHEVVEAAHTVYKLFGS